MGSGQKGFDKIMPNDVKLQEGHPVDENLRPIKVGGKSTAIETAQHGNGARITGDLEVTGNIKGNVKDVELDLTKAIDVQRRMFERRNVAQKDYHKRLLAEVYKLTSNERKRKKVIKKQIDHMDFM